mgnify:CR=1 FL=1
MSRFTGFDTLIRKGRTVPGWETALRRFNNTAALWPSAGSGATAALNCFYQGTVESVATTSTVDYDFTVALWVKVPKAATSNKGLWHIQSIPGGFSTVGMYWEYNGGSPNIRVDYGSLGVRFSLSEPIPLDDAWHCVVFSSSVANNRTYLRIDDGPIIDSTSVGAPVAPQGGFANLLRIGNYIHLLTQHDMADVYLDEMVWIDRHISLVADYDAIYNQGLPPDINEPGTWQGASLNQDEVTKWFRWDFDPNNGRDFTSGLVNSATGAKSITLHPVVHQTQLTTPLVTGAPFPKISRETTHQLQPDYAALAGAWGDWSKAVLFPSYGTRLALGVGIEMRNDSPGLMPESESGWGYKLQSSYITLNFEEPFSTPNLTQTVVGTGLFDDSLPTFNNDLQTAVDGRNLSRRDGLFVKRVNVP